MMTTGGAAGGGGGAKLSSTLGTTLLATFMLFTITSFMLDTASDMLDTASDIASCFLSSTCCHRGGDGHCRWVSFSLRSPALKDRRPAGEGGGGCGEGGAEGG
jgi:hypothetical protein